MASFTRLQVYQILLENPIMPIFHHNDVEVARKILTACYEGGIRICEFTNRGDFAHETYSELRKFGKKNFPEMVIGAGTIMDAASATLFIQLGADFVVAPVLQQEVAITCNRRKIGWMPGCFTLSEISQAEEWGAEIVKLFPGQASSPEFVKAIKGPMPWTDIVVTGGVEPTEASLKSWFDAGVRGVGMGSQLFPKKLVDSGEWQSITQKVEEAVRIAKALKA
ncbi:MAG: bifunctional 4-hydroxy-2-oxoglutarate aldolase/2-dehydro-3-deoxy-phosphogluconate aldolase [Siphonobacter sp.]